MTQNSSYKSILRQQYQQTLPVVEVAIMSPTYTNMKNTFVYNLASASA
jgi:hypothetical protein